MSINSDALQSKQVARRSTSMQATLSLCAAGHAGLRFRHGKGSDLPQQAVQETIPRNAVGDPLLQ
jgi:hypothetical protein